MRSCLFALYETTHLNQLSYSIVVYVDNESHRESRTTDAQYYKSFHAKIADIQSFKFKLNELSSPFSRG